MAHPIVLSLQISFVFNVMSTASVSRVLLFADLIHALKNDLLYVMLARFYLGVMQRPTNLVFGIDWYSTQFFSTDTSEAQGRTTTVLHSVCFLSKYPAQVLLQNLNIPLLVRIAATRGKPCRQETYCTMQSYHAISSVLRQT